MDIIEIGKRIEYARKQKKISLDEVAASVGVAKSTIQRYEKGLITTPKLPVLKAIADALGVNPDWLLLSSDEMILNNDEANALEDAVNTLVKQRDMKALLEVTLTILESSKDKEEAIVKFKKLFNM